MDSNLEYEHFDGQHEYYAFYIPSPNSVVSNFQPNNPASSTIIPAVPNARNPPETDPHRNAPRAPRGSVFLLEDNSGIDTSNIVFGVRNDSKLIITLLNTDGKLGTFKYPDRHTYNSHNPVHVNSANVWRRQIFRRTMSLFISVKTAWKPSEMKIIRTFRLWRQKKALSNEDVNKLRKHLPGRSAYLIKHKSVQMKREQALGISAAVVVPSPRHNAAESHSHVSDDSLLDDENDPFILTQGEVLGQEHIPGNSITGGFRPGSKGISSSRPSVSSAASKRAPAHLTPFTTSGYLNIRNPIEYAGHEHRGQQMFNNNSLLPHQMRPVLYQYNQQQVNQRPYTGDIQSEPQYISQPHSLITQNDYTTGSLQNIIPAMNPIDQQHNGANLAQVAGYMHDGRSFNRGRPSQKYSLPVSHDPRRMLENVHVAGVLVTAEEQQEFNKRGADNSMRRGIRIQSQHGQNHDGLSHPDKAIIQFQNKPDDSSAVGFQEDERVAHHQYSKFDMLCRLAANVQSQREGNYVEDVYQAGNMQPRLGQGHGGVPHVAGGGQHIESQYKQSYVAPHHMGGRVYIQDQGSNKFGDNQMMDGRTHDDAFNDVSMPYNTINHNRILGPNGQY